MSTLPRSLSRICPPAFALVAACADASPPAADEGSSGDDGIISLGEHGSAESPSSSDGTLDGDSDDGAKLDIGGIPDAGVEVDCDPLLATIRDFQSSHPDFETYSGSGAAKGLLKQQLGVDQTPDLDPAYAGPPMITSAETFAQWYHDVAGVNMPFPLELVLEPDDNDLFVYDSSAFFPIDGQGFGNEGNDHNFHFTTEVHTSFTYGGGEIFTFRGDDDLWIFVDGKLALDIGGLHPAVEDSIEMDTLGLTVGETYPMDIFHAERHTNESNFRIETTIACFVTPPPQG
jgi:fibro-slime domain-containing protein